MCRPATILLASVILVHDITSSYAETPKVAITRRIETTEDSLRQQLLDVPEVGFNQKTAAELYAVVDNHVSKNSAIRPDCGSSFYTDNVNKVAALTLPWQKGNDATRGKEHAETLNSLSTKLRAGLRNAVARRGDPPDSRALRRLVANEDKKTIRDLEWYKPQAIPTLVQLLQVEDKAIRELLIDTLAAIEGKEASIALAQRAIFDLSPTVREQAVQALVERPEVEYRQVLLDAFRYPWPAAADHAAEAIVALNRTEYVGHLVNQLKEPDSRRPRQTDKGKLVVEEMVRINHLSNCLLCHAPSQSPNDYVRGLIPTPYQDPPPLYYSANRGSFARADITYLRQDFSVVQPVLNAGKWPGQQRYDYLVRARPVTHTEVLKGFTPRTDLDPAGKKPTEAASGLFSEQYPERGAVLFALRKLTNKDLGVTFDAWAAFAKVEERPANEVVAKAQTNKLVTQLLAVDSGKRLEMIVTFRDAKGNEFTDALAHAVPQVSSEERVFIRECLTTRLARMNAVTLLDYFRQRDAELRCCAALACGSKDPTRMGEYIPSLIRLLSDDVPAVVQAARASLKVFSGKDYGPEVAAKGLDRVKAVTDWQQWWAAQQK